MSNKLEKPELSAKAIVAMLWDEIHSLREGESSAANLGAITNAAGKIFTSYALQMKYSLMTGSKLNEETGEFMGTQQRQIEEV